MCEEYVGKEILLEEAAKLKWKYKLSGVYSITNKINGKVYVGQSKHIYNRAAQHACGKTNKHLKNAIEKYSIVNFVHKIEMLCEYAALGINEVVVFAKYKENNTAMYNVAECGIGVNTMLYATDAEKAERVYKFKTTWRNKSTEEINDITSRRVAATRITIGSRSVEYDNLITAKRKILSAQYWERITKEQRELRCKNMSSGWSNRSDVDKDKFRVYRRNAAILQMSNVTKEDKDLINSKRSITWYNKSEEEKLASGIKRSITWSNKSEEERIKHRNKKQAAWDCKSKEEKAEHSNKLSAASKDKYTAVVNGVITLCLQNNIFTFSKYKLHCTINKLPIVVSPCYFDRIIYFGKNKDKLSEFVGIYKECISYNDYCLLCKLKPIPNAVYVVAVNYSTYKYFI